MRPRGFWARLALIGLLALTIRVGYVVLVERGDPLPGDGFYYHHAANLLADGEGFIDPARFLYGGAQEVVFFGEENVAPSAATDLPVGHREPTAGHPPAWTVLLAGASAVGLRSVLAHQLVGATVGALGVVAIGVLGREVWRTWSLDEARADQVGLAAALLGAGYAFLWLNDAMVMSESLVVPVVASATVLAIRLLGAPTRGRAAAFGALAALAALTRAELALFLPIVLAALIVRRRRPLPARVGVAAVATLVAVALVAPWAVRNTLAFDRPVLLSNGSGTVLVQANCDATYHGEKLGYWELLCGLPQPLGPGGEPLDEGERDAALRSRALDYIADNTTRLVTVVIPARVGRMWALYDPIQQLRFDILVQGRNFRLSVLGLAQYAVLVPLALAGAWHVRRRQGVLAPLIAWPAITTMTAVLAFGETRYRVASEVVIVTLAAVALVALAARARPAGSAPGASPVAGARQSPGAGSLDP